MYIDRAIGPVLERCNREGKGKLPLGPVGRVSAQIMRSIGGGKGYESYGYIMYRAYRVYIGVI